MVSFRKSPERIPEENITSPKNCRGVFAMPITFDVIILKNPESRRFIFSTIIEKRRIIVLISTALKASSIEIAPARMSADEPTSAIVARFILNLGYLPTATPIIERIIMRRINIS